MSALSGTIPAPDPEVSAALSARVVAAEGDRVGESVTLHHFGYVRMIACGAGPLRMTVRAGAEDAVALVVPRDGSVRLSQDGRTVCVASGQSALVDLGRAFCLEQEERGRVLFFRLPGHVLHVPAAALRSATARVLSSSADALTLVLRHLDESASGLPAAVGERLGGMVTDLVAGLVEESAEEPAGAGQRQLRLSVREYVERHLEDLDLSAERIARAHFISVRYLHRLFEGEDITVGRLIQRLRVEQCARELARRGRVSPSIAVVAARWGFRSPAHFSRAFKAVHGCSPQQWRRAAMTEGAA
ncbi:helix-turn-helix domain-containing protein [Streptomyces davaonensis]|uniref:helix-turn-helix domain-containing protein n=1 Tax=Streptomyces davaonensis TaxID=348043 RepID=UPI00034C684B|nr:helix-turn-helix domain-containing protein [Streptomyces davaonensis]